MRNSKKKGFTIVELVIVIAVIAILSAVLIPTFAGLVNKANEAALQENLTNAYTTYAASFEASDNELYSKEEVVFVEVDGNLTLTVENGKITKPVRGCTVVGSGAEVLMNIDMIGNNLATGHGMCGSASGSVPTDVGQPTIRVQNMTVGGRG